MKNSNDPNPYMLYIGKRYNKSNAEATKAITKGIQDGTINLDNLNNNTILHKYRLVGAFDSDTRSIIRDILKAKQRPQRLTKEDRNNIDTLVSLIMNSFMWEQIRPLYMQFIKRSTIEQLVKDTVPPMMKSKSHFDSIDRRIFNKYKEEVYKAIIKTIYS